jgi:complement component 1 Q subcomponent-binding protein, mitochondrial
MFRRAATTSEVDEELSVKLDSEITFEKDVKNGVPQPASVKDFLDSGMWDIEDVPGQEKVTLKRVYNNET